MTQLRFNGLLFHMTHDSGSVVQWFFVSYDSINKGKYTTEKNFVIAIQFYLPQSRNAKKLQCFNFYIFATVQT